MTQFYETECESLLPTWMNCDDPITGGWLRSRGFVVTERKDDTKSVGCADGWVAEKFVVPGEDLRIRIFNDEVFDVLTVSLVQGNQLAKTETICQVGQNWSRGRLRAWWYVTTFQEI